MSESKEHFHRDFSKFDEMSTAELNEILRQDSQLPDGEESDIDAILYIMEVIEKRSQELPLSDFKDVDRAWSSFNENYRFASSDERSLFDLDDEPQQNSTSDKMQILHRVQMHVRTNVCFAQPVSLRQLLQFFWRPL